MKDRTRHIEHILIIGILFVFVNSCWIDNNQREIDYPQSLMIIQKMERWNIERLALNYNDLIINDTLIYIDSIGGDTITNRPWTREQVEMKDWIDLKHYSQDSLIALRNLMVNSSNKRIIMDSRVYFFNEGGWIDSDYGKAYSTEDISEQRNKFKFTRVQVLEPIINQKNWYTYYAD